MGKAKRIMPKAIQIVNERRVKKEIPALSK